ncbi:MAG: hypothetical protein M3024_03370 [Candidatus Dormibacteraeota bacterium]|nr:hypothetical protein [Candidatus Dormibacteraeota bacterium]
MSDDTTQGGGGFGWGLFFGLVLGAIGGAWLASGPGREQVDGLRERTIELTGTARRAATDPEHPVRRAIQEGVSAAKRRREELDQAAAESRPAGTPGGAPDSATRVVEGRADG